MMGKKELINEMEFKRARAGVSFAKMAFNLITDPKVYALWLSRDREPDDKQLGLIKLWISDQLRLEEVS